MKGRPKGSRNLPRSRDPLTIPRHIEKQIFALSQQSGMAPQQVLIDALQGGIINVRLFVYKELIEYRKSLREQLDGTEEDTDLGGNTDAEDTRQVSGLGGSQTNGDGDGGLVGETDLDGDVSDVRSAIERSDLAPVGPGLGPSGDEALNGDRGDAE